MNDNVYDRASYVVSDVILKQVGIFTLKDILDIVSSKIESQFESVKKMTDYVINKLNSMCEFGLIGRTSIYYFSI